MTNSTRHPKKQFSSKNLLVTLDSRWLLCANMPGNSVIVLQIDTASGSIKSHGEPVKVPMASSIRW